MSRLVQHRLVLLICIMLTGVTVWIYWQTLDFELTHHDDNVYVTDNPDIRAGLSWTTIENAFTSQVPGMYMPMLWLSYSLDYAIGELDPQVYHAHNLVLYLANIVLLLVLLVRLTGSVWPSALAVALYAVHPLRVESVAWVAERKDVLSTLFWILAIFAYVKYLNKPAVSRYLVLVLLFILGLLSKAMLVTLPVTLLLLDYWPLQRLNARKPKLPRLLVEKLPLFAASLAFGVLTVIVMNIHGADPSIERLSFTQRLAGAVFAYIFLIWKFLWPADLAFHYPPSVTTPSTTTVVLGFLGLIATTYLSIRLSRRHPYILFGWLWYLVTLLPISGIVQHGRGRVYDHFSYVPHIGLCIAISWGLAALLRTLSVRLPRTSTIIQCSIVPAGAVAILLSLAWVSKAQTAHWRNDFTLFGHAIRVTKHNAVAHFNLGNSYAAKGDLKEAMRHFRLAVAADPRKDDALMNLGALLLHEGKIKEALYYLRRSESLNPTIVETQIALAQALMSDGKYKDAVRHFEAALRLRPNDPDIEADLQAAKELAGVSTGVSD